MSDRQYTVRLVGGPYDGKEMPYRGGTRVEWPRIYPPKRQPGPDDGMVVDGFGFVRWVDPDCNPTITNDIYKFEAIDGDVLIASYEGEVPHAPE